MSNKTGSKKNASKAAAQSRFAEAASSAGVPSATGMRAVEAKYRPTIELKPTWDHTDSVDLDTHFEPAEPDATRWDYGLGVKNGNGELAFWVEPHPASSTSQVAEMIEKVKWLKDKLNLPAFDALKRLTDETQRAGHGPYRWIYTGSLRITQSGKEAKLLAKAGIGFPQRYLKLPS